jgi:hypothetical protein
MKPHSRDSFDRLKECITIFQRFVCFIPDLHDDLDRQIDEILHAFRDDPPTPGDFSSPIVTLRFTTLADLCKRFVLAASLEAAGLGLNKEPIVEFFAFYKFPIDLTIPNLGMEDDYLDDPELFVRMAKEEMANSE